MPIGLSWGKPTTAYGPDPLLYPMTDSPLLLLVLAAGATYIAHLWWSDFKAAQAGAPNPKGFPGATAWNYRALLIAVSGALVLLGLETWGEIVLGISGQQSELKLSLAVYTIFGAPIIEELIMRGYLFFDKKGSARFWTAAVACSVLFALLHPHLWEWRDAAALDENPVAPEALAIAFGSSALVFDFGAKAWFTTGILFTFSLWLYFTRYASFNKERSLLVPVAAHAAKNAGVVVIKAVQGFLVIG